VVKTSLKALVGLGAVAGGLSSPAAARAAFVDGTFAVVRLGDGTGTVPFNASNLAQPTYLDVYNVRTGAAVSSTPLPSASADAGRFVLSSSTSDDEGRLNLSADGRYLTLGGFRSTPGAANPVAQSVARVIARVDSNYAADTSTTLAGGYAGVPITAVASFDGQQFWTVGGNEAATASGGLRYVPGVGGTAHVNVSRTQSGANADSYRGARMVDGKLVGNTASQGSFTNRGAYQLTINGSLPAAATPTAATATPIIVNAEGSLTDGGGNNDFDSAGSPQSNGKQYPKTDAVFVDLDRNGVRETAYTTGGKDDFQKWTLTGGTWVRNSSMFLSSGLDINALDAYPDGSSLDLLISTDAGIYKLVDTGGVGAAVASGLANADGFGRRFYTDPFFLTPGANTQFRGLAVVPEPAGASVVAAAAVASLLSRRRRAGRSG
jgi:hypothetical protein